MKPRAIVGLASVTVMGLLAIIALRNPNHPGHNGAGRSSMKTAANLSRITAVTNSSATAASTVDPTYFAKESWSYSGWATPEATLQTMLWAFRQQDIRWFIDSLTPAANDQFQRGYEGVAAAQIKDEMRQGALKIKGYRIIDRTMVAPDKMRLTVNMDGADGPEVKFFRLVNGQWKLDVNPKTRRR